MNGRAAVGSAPMRYVLMLRTTFGLTLIYLVVAAIFAFIRSR